MDTIIQMVASVLDVVVDTFLYVVNPMQRVFWLYLVTSAIAAFFVWRALRARTDHATERDAEAAKGSFLRFLFPRHVWSHPSAWLDLRYALFHKVVSHFLLLGLTGFAISLGYRIATGGERLTTVLSQTQITTAAEWIVAILFMIVAVAVSDFIAWACHYAQHKVPVLWQFHKVHHSAEVMHPISNYREHPVDNLTYGFFVGLGYGVVYALAVTYLGFLPTMPTLLGVPILMFVFNVVAYNLRHSHVWLKWPGKWSAVFPSPAHHHVHHSCHPDHIDKNFAFMFPVWDVLFGTYIMPEDNRDVKFGVPPEQGRDLDSVWRLYWVPFRDAYRELTRRKRPAAGTAPDTDVTPDTPSAQFPAE
ncbi:hypothetical protein HKCCE2091_00690 [Rhodobacterales bacterium HKCCE2091]|nr:hypothetical protein [Rhodobacterales bacterium HKCCE2091]